jgi:carbon-monoxide dehydrogenase catalytic subunit
MIFATSYFPTMTCGIVPGSVGRELLEAGHETSMGTMADPTSLILHAARLGIADITSLIIGTELQDVLFGIPRPVLSRIGLGVLDKDKVNVVIHGHVPLIAEKIVQLSEDRELLDNAQSFGATGINIVGCCCTGNEMLMRHGVPLVGSTLQQELVILTGLVEAFVVDVQCIYPNIEIVAENFHTKIITTMNEARITNTEHVPFTEEYADEMAKRILDIAVRNFPKRGKIRKKIDLYLPKEEPIELMGGFSAEICLDILSRLNPDDPLKPLIDNIISGDIYGIVLFAGCLNPRVTAYESHATIAKELMKRNVLIIATGCAAEACAKAGLLVPEASNYVGKNLKNVLNIFGKVAGLEKSLPPILFFGSCVDNSRAITLVTAIAEKLGVSIKDLPIATSVAEGMTEKAMAIGIGAVGLGITVHVGVPLPTIGSPNVTALLTQKSEELFDGRFIVETDPIKASQQLLEHISKARTTLGLTINTNQPFEHVDNAGTLLLTHA